MNTDKERTNKDKKYFFLVLGISLVVPAVVVALKLIPDEYRPNLEFAKFLPKLNGIINSMVTVFLLFGFIAIKRLNNRKLHEVFMFTAFLLSVVFLVSYVIKGAVLPETKYGGDGALKYIYYFVLISHIILAACILPMVLYTMYFSYTGRYEKHKKIARITWPLWLYVSITGVLVYVMISPYYPF